MDGVTAATRWSVRSWPFVGRSDTMHVLLRGLSAGESFLLGGESGIGKSSVLETVAGHLRAGGTDVVTLAGVETTADLPLAPLLSFTSANLPSSPAPQALVEAALTEICRRGSVRALVLVVDDVHLLTDEVAAFLHRVLVNHLAIGLLARRSGEPLRAPLDRLARRGDVELIDLEPLTTDDSIAAVEHALGGPLGPTAARELCDLSYGNPLYLRELVLDALETGVLVANEEGLWHFTAPVRAGRRVHELVEGRLSALPASEHDVLAMVALQRPMPAEVLSEVSGRSAMLALVDRGLLVIDEQGRRLMASPSHSVHAAAALSGMNPIRRRRLLRAAAAAWQRTSMHRAEDHAIVSRLLLAAGCTPTPRQLLHAVDAPGLSPAGATELADAAERSVDGTDGDGLVDACVARGLALARSFRWPEAAESFERALVVGEGHERTIAVQYVRAALDHDTDPAAVVTLAERLDSHLHGEFEAAVAVEGAAMFIRPLEATITRVARLTDDDAFPSELRPQLTLLQCTAQSHRGDLHAARRTAETLTADGVLDRVGRSRAQSVVVEASAWLGELGHALAVALPELDQARLRGELDHELLMRRVLQVTLTLAGRIGEAVAHGRRMTQILSFGHGLRVAPAVHHELALALSELRGGAAEAEATLDAAGRLPSSARYVWAADGLVAASRLESSDTSRLELLHEAEAAARERDCRIHLARALHERVRWGIGESPAEELAELGSAVGGVPRLWSRHARAIEDSDHDALSALSLDAERTGMVRLAAESAAKAAHLALRKSGCLGAATILAERCQRLHGQIRETVLATDAPALPLTAREQHVITAALDGSTDAAIASAWTVSVRTVHGHLHRAYRKLGVEGREELTSLRAQHDPVEPGCG